MDLAILGGFIGLGLAFMSCVLFKLNRELHRNDHHKLGLDRPSPSSPAVGQDSTTGAEDSPDARVRTAELKMKSR